MKIKFNRSVLAVTLGSIMLMVSLVHGSVSTQRQSSSQVVSAEHWLSQWVVNGPTKSYRAHALFSSGDQLKTVKVLHTNRGGHEYEKLIHLNGEPAEIWRRGEHIICVSPGHDAIHFENSHDKKNSGLYEMTGSQEDAQRLGRIKQYYELRLHGEERVAGQNAVKLELRPKDRDRYRRYLWIDKVNGLMVKGHTVDESARLLESMEFVSLEVERDDNALMSEMDALSGEIEEKFQTFLNAKQHESHAEFSAGSAITPNWKAQWLPDGFELVDIKMERAEKTADEPVEARSVGSYSDGLAGFTLFLETVANDAPALNRRAQRSGATVSLTRLIGDTGYQVTLVGELPPVTATRIVGSIRIAEPR